jgi:hypothetical protein
VAGAATQTRDDPTDAPDAPGGKSDLRRIAWDVSDTAAALKVSLDTGALPEALGVHVLLDTDDNGIADRELVATRNPDDVRADVELRELDGALSNGDCQDLAGPAGGVQGPVTTTVADGLETFTFAFDPALVPGGLASFRWAAFAQPPPTSNGGAWDFLPEGVSTSLQ